MIEHINWFDSNDNEVRILKLYSKQREIIDNINKIILKDNNDNSHPTFYRRDDRQGKDDSELCLNNSKMSQPAVCSKGYFCPCHDKSGDNKDCCPMCKKEVKHE